MDLTKFKTTNGTAKPAGANVASGALSGLKDAETWERNPTFSPGAYIATVTSCKVFPSKKKAGHNFLVEFTIEENVNGKDAKGDKRVWIQSIDPGGIQRGMALGAIRAFALAVLAPKDQAEREAIEENLEEVVVEATEKGGFDGNKVQVNCTMNSAKDGKEYARLTFSPVK